MGMVFCRGCGKEIHESAPSCPQCGAPQGIKNTASEIIPDGVKGWSWGAFFLSGFWAIGNKTWIGLLAFVPYVGFIMSFVLGFKGREWAWKNKQWDSLEHFNRVQKKWSFWAGIIFLIALVVGLVIGGIIVYQNYQHKAQDAVSEKQALVELAAKEEKLLEAKKATANYVQLHQNADFSAWLAKVEPSDNNLFYATVIYDYTTVANHKKYEGMSGYQSTKEGYWIDCGKMAVAFHHLEPYLTRMAEGSPSDSIINRSWQNLEFLDMAYVMSAESTASEIDQAAAKLIGVVCQKN